jgi:hypothetical protein
MRGNPASTRIRAAPSVSASAPSGQEAVACSCGAFAAKCTSDSNHGSKFLHRIRRSASTAVALHSVQPKQPNDVLDHTFHEPERFPRIRCSWVKNSALNGGRTVASPAELAPSVAPAPGSRRGLREEGSQLRICKRLTRSLRPDQSEPQCRPGASARSSQHHPTTWAPAPAAAAQTRPAGSGTTYSTLG